MQKVLIRNETKIFSYFFLLLASLPRRKKCDQLCGKKSCIEKQKKNKGGKFFDKDCTS